MPSGRPAWRGQAGQRWLGRLARPGELGGRLPGLPRRHEAGVAALRSWSSGQDGRGARVRPGGSGWRAGPDWPGARGRPGHAAWLGADGAPAAGNAVHQDRAGPAGRPRRRGRYRGCGL